MPVFEYIKNQPGDPDFVFHCPGCDCLHGVWTTTRNDNKAIWEFNGDVEKPTVKRSLSIKFYQNGKMQTCHSFITDGNIQFLQDSTHHLAGQTVQLKPIP